MPIKPANNCDRIAAVDILTRFLHRNLRQYDSLTTLHEKTYEKYHRLASPVDANLLNIKFKHNRDIDMMDKNLFLYLEPTNSDGMLPLVTIQSSNDWIHFRIYVLLTMLHGGSTLKELAIRFETDEGYFTNGSLIGAHDFCHAQLCRNIGNIYLTTIPEWMPDSQPSFPLDANDQITLVICMLISIYGGSHVLGRLSASGDRDLRKHFSKIRAFQSN